MRRLARAPCCKVSVAIGIRLVRPGLVDADVACLCIGELGQLRAALEGAHQVLAPGARLAVISFHSLEDRIVKQFMRLKSSVDPVFAGLPMIPPSARPTMQLVGRKWRAGSEEVARNPRARSAVLRCAERLGPEGVPA